MSEVHPTPSVIVERTDTSCTVVVNDEQVLTAPTLPQLLHECTHLPSNRNPLSISNGTQLLIPTSTSERAAILSAISPSPDSEQALWDLEEGRASMEIEDDFGGMPWDRDPEPAGIRLADKTWGWFHTLSGWRLLPDDFQEASSLVGEIKFIAYSGFASHGWRILEFISLTWSWATESKAVLDLDYGANFDDLVSKVVLDGLIGEPMCPECDTNPWDVYISLSEKVGESAAADVVQSRFIPCGRHRSLTLQAAGRSWSWHDGHWQLTAG
ncbi:MAG: hypothetical protein GY788_07975 [bacterium]|nr:hypothetical protein [bacterium]